MSPRHYSFPKGDHVLVAKMCVCGESGTVDAQDLRKDI